eukprot:g13819.t1
MGLVLALLVYQSPALAVSTDRWLARGTPDITLPLPKGRISDQPAGSDLQHLPEPVEDTSRDLGDVVVPPCCVPFCAFHVINRSDRSPHIVQHEELLANMQAQAELEQLQKEQEQSTRRLLEIEGQMEALHQRQAQRVEEEPKAARRGYLGIADGSLEGFNYFGVQASRLPRVVVFDDSDHWVEDEQYLTVERLAEHLPRVTGMWRMSNTARGHVLWIAKHFVGFYLDLDAWSAWFVLDVTSSIPADASFGSVGRCFVVCLLAVFLWAQARGILWLVKAAINSFSDVFEKEDDVQKKVSAGLLSSEVVAADRAVQEACPRRRVLPGKLGNTARRIERTCSTREQQVLLLQRFLKAVPDPLKRWNGPTGPLIAVSRAGHPSSDAELDEAAKEEAERKAREEEEEEKEARKVASKLAVLFVISPDSYHKSKKVADQVLKWCELSGAECAIIPSPDVLVYTLAKYAEEKTGTSVTFHQIHNDAVDNQSDKDLEKDWTVTTLPNRETSPSFELPEPSCSSNGTKQAWVA